MCFNPEAFTGQSMLLSKRKSNPLCGLQLQQARVYDTHTHTYNIYIYIHILINDTKITAAPHIVTDSFFLTQPLAGLGSTHQQMLPAKSEDL